MPAIDGLTEVAGHAALAESTARSVTWQDQEAIDEATERVAASLARDRETLSRPSISAVEPSPAWRFRLQEMLEDDRDELTEPPPEDPVLAAAQAEADADTAVAIARLALIEAHRAVLQSRGAALRAGDSEAVAEAIRGFRPLPPGHPAIRHGKALGGGVNGELSALLRSRPRPILVKLGISLGLGLAYLGFIRLFQWDDKSELLPFLALYALSGVIGGVVCTNALSWDAGRVRAALTSGRRLWHLLLGKNITMFLLVGAVGLVLSVLLAWRAGDFSTLIKAIGQLATMMLLWLGIGNVLSVVSPLRVEPLKERFKDGTIRPFLLSFATSYILGLGVNLMLTWRVWAKETMISELGGPLIPVLFLVLSALVTYLLLTVLAVSLADQPRIRRALLREMIDYKSLQAAEKSEQQGRPKPPNPASEAVNGG
jgi:hypothetical protein